LGANVRYAENYAVERYVRCWPIDDGWRYRFHAPRRRLRAVVTSRLTFHHSPLLSARESSIVRAEIEAICYLELIDDNILINKEKLVPGRGLEPDA
jgi:hypothetical protein